MKTLSTKSGEKITTTAQRNRTFATVVYPESAPSDWRRLLEELKIPCLISPPHDRDINADGAPKKLHFHVVFYFEGKKSTEQVRELFSAFGGVGVEVVNSMRGYARYLCHLDNPEKAQYSPSDVISIGGIDYADLIKSAADRHALIRQMTEYIVKEHIVEFADLYEYALENNEEWFNSLNDNSAFVIKEYIRSRRHRATEPVVIDKNTGELLRAPVYNVTKNEDVSKCSEDVSESSTWCGATREEWEKLYGYAIKEPSQSSEKPSDREKPTPDDECPF